MNDNRRKQVKIIIKKIEDIINETETIHDDENEYLENIPENLQSSGRYETAENACDILEEAASDLQEVIDKLNDIL